MLIKCESLYWVKVLMSHCKGPASKTQFKKNCESQKQYGIILYTQKNKIMFAPSSHTNYCIRHIYVKQYMLDSIWYCFQIWNFQLLLLMLTYKVQFVSFFKSVVWSVERLLSLYILKWPCKLAMQHCLSATLIWVKISQPHDTKRIFTQSQFSLPTFWCHLLT